MFSRAPHRVAVLVLLSYIAGSILVETTHQDVHDLLLHSRPVLEQHDCGANEIHISVEDVRHCLACSQLTQRFATEDHITTVAVLDLPAATFHTERAAQLLTADILHSGKRGPPRT